MCENITEGRYLDYCTPWRVAVRWLLFLPLALLLFGINNATAQDRTPSEERVMTAKSIRCQYTSTTIMNFRSEPKLSKSSEPPVTFDSINLKEGTARQIGKGGAGTVFILVTPMTLNFIERTPAGLSIDTIFTASEKTGKYSAVNSRHIDLISPLPNQSYGQCWVLE